MSPAPRLLLGIPVLPARAIEEALTFYEQKLGFSRHIDSDDYAGVERDGIQIHFWLCEDPEIAKNTSCRINVSGLDVIHDACRRAGAIAEGEEPEAKEWGFREFAVVDPSGNLVIFAEEIEGWVEE